MTEKWDDDRAADDDRVGGKKSEQRKHNKA